MTGSRDGKTDRCNDPWDRSESGSSSVEFAMILPLFLLLLFGIIQFGAVLFLHNNMVNAAREATRRMAVAEMTADEAEAFADNYLAGWGLGFTINAVEPGAAEPNGDVSVSITVPAAEAVLVNFPINWPGNVAAQVTMRREG